MKKALITGANKGIGLEVARQLLQKGYYVYLGSSSLFLFTFNVLSSCDFPGNAFLSD